MFVLPESVVFFLTKFLICAGLFLIGIMRFMGDYLLKGKQETDLVYFLLKVGCELDRFPVCLLLCAT